MSLSYDRRLDRLEHAFGVQDCTCHVGPELVVIVNDASRRDRGTPGIYHTSEPPPAPPCPVHGATRSRLVVAINDPTRREAPAPVATSSAAQHLPDGRVAVLLPPPGPPEPLEQSHGMDR